MANPPKSIEEELKRVCDIYHADDESEVGLYGGTFTAMRGWKETLVEIGKNVEKLGLKGIRISTRPDEIKDLDFLLANHVTSVEIGAQSMCDDVLEASKRGHTAEDVVSAVNLLKAREIFVSVHLMTGLPQDTKEKAIFSAVEVAKLHPDAVRIHPTLVLKDTELAEMYAKGKYEPQNLEKAVDWVTNMLAIFIHEGTIVERLGMYQDSRTLPNVIAGPYHPAFGELCRANLYKEFLKAVEAEKVAGPSNLRSQITGRNKLKIEFVPTDGEITAFSREKKIKFSDWLSRRVLQIREMAKCDL